MNETQKRDAARDFMRSAVLPLIEDVLVKKFCQSMDVIAEQNRDLSEKAGAYRADAERLRAALHSLATVARRYLPDYDEHPEIQKADDALDNMPYRDEIVGKTWKRLSGLRAETKPVERGA